MLPLQTFHRYLRGSRALLATTAFGLLATALLALWIAAQTRQHARQMLEQITDAATQQIEARLSNQAEIMRGLQGAFIARPQLDQRTFYDILDSQNILARVPGLIAISFARRIQATDTQRFIASLNSAQSGLPSYYQGYQIHPKSHHFVIQPIEYLYPLNKNTAVLLGADLLSQTPNTEALTISRDEGRAISTPAIPLALLTDKTPAIMVHYPVYNAGVRPQTLPERQSSYVGSLTALYRPEPILHALDAGLLAKAMYVRLYDTGGTLSHAAPSPERLLAEFRHDTEYAGSAMCSQRLINIPGRQWRFEYCATPEQINPASKDNLWLCWLIGGVLTLLSCCALQLKNRSHILATQIAEEVSADLRRHKTRHLKLALLADEAQDIMVIRSANGQIEYANPAAQRRFQPGGASLLHSPEPLLVSAELGQLTEPMITQCSHRAPSGDIRHYEAMLLPMHDPQGQDLGSALIARDITARIEHAELLRRANERLSDLLELSSDWLWEQNTEARFTHVSGGFFKLNELNPAHATGRSRRELEYYGITEHAWLAQCKIIEARQAYRDFVLTLPIGNENAVLSISGKPVHDDSGLFQGYRGVGRDITALHQAKTLAQTEKQRVLATLESLSDGIITTDLAGRIDYMNPVAIALTGRELAEAMGQQIEMVFQVVDITSRLPLPSLPRQALSNTYVSLRHRNAILLNRFGLTFSIQEAVACILNQNNEVVGSVVVFRDLSDWMGQTKLMESNADPAHK